MKVKDGKELYSEMEAHKIIYDKIVSGFIAKHGSSVSYGEIAYWIKEAKNILESELKKKKKPKIMRGTVYLRNFHNDSDINSDSEKKWYFVSELPNDIGIDYGMIPNNSYIESEGFEILNPEDLELEENKIIEIDYHKSVFYYEIKDCLLCLVTKD